jgi:hypothetical protein
MNSLRFAIMRYVAGLGTFSPVTREASFLFVIPCILYAL